jgi:hypothetical protein
MGEVRATGRTPVTKAQYLLVIYSTIMNVLACVPLQKYKFEAFSSIVLHTLSKMNSFLADFSVQALL